MPGEKDLRRQHILGLESQVEILKFEEAADHQAGAREQHERQRHLRDDQCRSAALAADAALLRGIHEIRARHLQRGRHAESHAGQQRDHRDEQQHGRVDADLIDARQIGRTDAHEQAEDRPGHQHAEHAAHDREQHALGQQLTNQAPAPGAERRAHRHLAAPRRGADEQQVRDVRARDQQHEADRTQEHQQSQADVLDQQVVRAHHRRIRIAGRVGGGDALCDGRHVCGRGVDGHAVLEAAEHGQRVQAASRQLAWTEHQRRVHVGRDALGKPETRRHHADHGKWGAGQRDRFADEPAIAAVAPLPEFVPQHDDAIAARFLLIGEGAADERRNSEHAEQAARERNRGKTLGLAGTS